MSLAAFVLVGCGKQSTTRNEEPAVSPAEAPPVAKVDLGIETAGLSPVIDNPYVAFATVKRAVYEGKEYEPDTRHWVKIRTESVTLDTAETIAGVKVTAVTVTDFDDGEMTEQTKDYYAQDPTGAVYYIGERVDEFDGGKLVSHGGQWMAGESGSRAGVFMPAAPKVGDVFEQERAPGVAEDRTTVIAVGKTVTVPAGTFKNCIETEDFDPIKKASQKKVYCPGVGLVREVFDKGGSSELVKLEKR